MGELSIEYRDIPSSPEYQAGSDGLIYSKASGKALKSWLAGSSIRYPYVSLGTAKKGAVHRFVCEAFHGQCPEGCEVAHADGNPLNSKPSNLRWATHGENVADTVAMGRHKPQNFFRPGQKKRGPKSTRHPQADFILEMREAGAGYGAIAKALGISKSGVIHAIKNRCAT